MNIKWIAIFMAVIVICMCITDREREKTDREREKTKQVNYAACIKETKDNSKCNQ